MAQLLGQLVGALARHALVERLERVAAAEAQRQRRVEKARLRLQAGQLTRQAYVRRPQRVAAAVGAALVGAFG